MNETVPPSISQVTSAKLPQGIRTNNPGNLRRTLIAWEGLSGSYKGFCTFNSPSNGIRALAIDLWFSNRMHSRDTLRKIISVYAPYSENKTDSYEADVSADMQYDLDRPIDLRDFGHAFALVRAIIKHENGRAPNTLPSCPEWFPIDVVMRAMFSADKWPERQADEPI